MEAEEGTKTRPAGAGRRRTGRGEERLLEGKDEGNNGLCKEDDDETDDGVEDGLLCCFLPFLITNGEDEADAGDDDDDSGEEGEEVQGGIDDFHDDSRNVSRGAWEITGRGRDGGRESLRDEEESTREQRRGKGDQTSKG